jgi:hypothetical protein
MKGPVEYEILALFQILLLGVRAELLAFIFLRCPRFPAGGWKKRDSFAPSRGKHQLDRKSMSLF